MHSRVWDFDAIAFPIDTIAPILRSALVILISCWVGYYSFTSWVEYRLPYRNLPKPKPAHWFLGSMPEILNNPPGAAFTEWIKEFGHTVRYTVFAGTPRFLTTDPLALTYILNHPDLFVKPGPTRRGLESMLGNGVFVADGDVHRRQRKILNPAFGQRAIDDMMPVFFDKAYELTNKLVHLVNNEDESQSASPTPAAYLDRAAGGRKVDVLKFVAQATLDIIGLAGFNYDFKSLSTPYSELAEAYREMMSAGMRLTPMAIIQSVVPGLMNLPTKRMRTIWASRNVIENVARRLIKEMKMSAAQGDGKSVEKSDVVGKDILSILVRANMAADLAPNQRLSDPEVMAQISTFMLAGNETSSTALTWMLYALSQHLDIQNRLREELAAVTDDRPSMEIISTLSYLDAFVREGLRLYPPPPVTLRETTADCTIPFGKPIVGRDGSSMTQVVLPKGTTIMIPFIVINASPEFWGPNAATFNPDRFLTKSPENEEKLQQLPSLYSHLLTFGGGPRNCIGYKFALTEIKVILFILLRNLSFEELPSKPVVEKKTAMVMRPKIKGEDEAGLQMPLMVKILSA